MVRQSPGTVRGFASLFHGRSEVWFDSDSNRPVYRRCSLGTYRKHIEGPGPAIGTYPLTEDSSVRWSCIDVDEDNIGLARHIQDTWEQFGCSAWLERSRSKGWHIWVFMDSWISASVLRSAGLYVALLCDVPKIEVNPKQNAPWELQKGIGNTVRLPYPHNRPEGRMVMVDQDGKDIPLDAFVASAMAIRTDASKVRLVARRMEVLERSRQIAPIEEEPSKRFRPSGELGISSQDAFAIIDGNRRIEAGERDNQFFAIANALLGTGRSLNDAVTIIRRIYNEQTDQVGFTWEEALAKVRNVYGQRH